MAKNAYKIRRENKGTGSVFNLLERILRMESIFAEGIPSQYVPHTLFLSLMALIYIGNTHYSEKSLRLLSKLEMEVEELRADFTSLKADYMFASKQSEVAKKVISSGLVESEDPPYKIEVKRGEY